MDLNVWLQDFAWLQSDLPRKLAARQARPEEPMFCFELALKLLYWAALVYYTEVSGQRVGVLHGGELAAA